MNESIQALLMRREGYSPRAAHAAARDLANLRDREIAQAFRRWAAGGRKTDLVRGPFSCRQLMAELGMKYPAALIFLDWYAADPASALDAMRCQGGWGP